MSARHKRLTEDTCFRDNTKTLEKPRQNTHFIMKDFIQGMWVPENLRAEPSHDCPKNPGWSTKFCRWTTPTPASKIGSSWWHHTAPRFGRLRECGKKCWFLLGKDAKTLRNFLRPGSPVHIKHAPETIVFGEDGRLGGTDWRPWSWDARGFQGGSVALLEKKSLSCFRGYIPN